MTALIFYPALCRDTCIERMFDHGHLGHSIRNLNDFCWAATTRQHDVHPGGRVRKVCKTSSSAIQPKVIG